VFGQVQSFFLFFDGNPDADGCLDEEGQQRRGAKCEGGVAEGAQELDPDAVSAEDAHRDSAPNAAYAVDRDGADG